MHTAAFGTISKQAGVGSDEPRSVRRKRGARSDKPVQQAKDLHVRSEFLWTRAHR